MPAVPRPHPSGSDVEIRPKDGERIFSATALITGFGPFPGVPRNPSGVLAARLAASRQWARLGWDVRHRFLPTGYAIARGIIREEARVMPAPAFVVMLGVAARAKWLRVESLARNRVSVTHRDATRARPGSACLAPGAEAIRRGRHPGSPLLAALRAGGVPARLSRDCGRYVCNASYWAMLEAMPPTTQVVFVHIPMPRPAARKRDSRPDMAGMERALARLIRVMTGFARR